MVSYKNPKIWGPSTWIFLHSMSFSYPEKPTKKEKKNYKNFLTSLQYVLPCSLCREHYAEYIKKHSLDEALESQKKMINYFIKLHNHINQKYKNKPKLTIQEAKNSFHNFSMSQLI